MKPLFTILLAILVQFGFAQINMMDMVDKVVVAKSDSSISFAFNTLSNNQFGFSSPDVSSEKIIGFSIYSDDIKDNPQNCKYGVYSIPIAPEKYRLKFSKSVNGFTEVLILDGEKIQDTFYVNLEPILVE